MSGQGKTTVYLMDGSHMDVCEGTVHFHPVRSVIQFRNAASDMMTIPYTSIKYIIQHHAE